MLMYLHPGNRTVIATRPRGGWSKEGEILVRTRPFAAFFYVLMGLDASKLQIQKLLCVSDVSIVEANRISSKEAYDRYIKSAWPNGNTGIKTKNCFGQVRTMVPFTLPPLPR